MVVEASDKTEDEMDLCQRQQNEIYKDVKISEQLTEPQQKEVRELLEEFETY